ncbi:MAG: Stp1/IreP family PP2C-type Ser/Thr phosphatase [Clostridia bacterium]|nr:Stp1/IreP family PP2C-type Ser/Thr phosphatase [Clostridia bacterium]
MQVGFKTDKGKTRFNNEDACFVMLHDKVFVVADGVGGGNSGEIASRMAVSQAANYVLDHPIEQCKNDVELKEYLEDCVNFINRQVYLKSKAHIENDGMATTLVMAYMRGGNLYIMNVGDSRAYVYRNKNLVQITEDHTYVNTLVKAGLISSEEAKTHENRNMITRAIGMEETIDADFFKISMDLEDIILICTDGLHGELSPGIISKVLDENLSMSETCGKLITLANQSGGKDNITVISLKVTEEDINE